MKIPEILDAVELLRHYQIKKAYTAAVLATDLEDFGGRWSEDEVGALLAGRKKLSGEKKIFIHKYLLDRYNGEVLV